MQILPLAERPQHLGVVANWVWSEWRAHSGLSEEQTRQRLLDPADCPPTLIAEEDDAPLGVLGFQRFVRTPEEPSLLFVDCLYVADPFRRRGVGSALIREGVERARAFAPDLYVYTSQGDWYRRQGWSLFQVDSVSGLFVLIRATDPGAGR